MAKVDQSNYVPTKNLRAPKTVPRVREQLLKQRKSCFLPLADSIDIDGDGKWCATEAARRRLLTFQPPNIPLASMAGSGTALVPASDREGLSKQAVTNAKLISTRSWTQPDLRRSRTRPFPTMGRLSIARTIQDSNFAASQNRRLNRSCSRSSLIEASRVAVAYMSNEPFRLTRHPASGPDVNGAGSNASKVHWSSCRFVLGEAGRFG